MRGVVIVMLLNTCAALAAILPGQSQDIILDFDAIEVVGELPDIIHESSGLVLTAWGTLIGHNDSGDDPVLYEFTTEGDVLRKITIKNVKHKDWEDITADDAHLYIGDFGNNFGRRKDLKVYRIDWPQAGAEDIEVDAEVIAFSYADQDDFNRRQSHNYDCEGMVSYGDSLYLFTKNRGDARTNVYTLSKRPGEYVLRMRTSFNVKGLITAADLRDDELILLGYNYVSKSFEPFIWTFSGFRGADFFSGLQKRVDLPMKAQTEAVIFENGNTILFTNEEEKGGKGYMYRVDIEDLRP